MSLRSDNLLTSLGNRTTGLRRLWVEDSFSRLTTNGFAVGTGFVVEPRVGPGLNIRPSALARCHVSQRRGAAILSYEGSDNMARFQDAEVRLKISCNLVQVLPSLRVFSVRQRTDEVWSLTGDILTTPRGVTVIRDGLERPAGRPASFEVHLTSRNLIAATALIAWAKPASIRLLSGAAPMIAALPVGQLDLFAAPVPTVSPVGDDTDSETAVTQEVARQFFVACGYEMTEPGLFRR